MNIFEMYYKNGKQAGFWVRRDSWRNIVAKVVSISGFKEGSLKGVGRFPFFNDAEVYAEIYKIEGGTLKRENPKFGFKKDEPDLAIISSPGTYAYTLIDNPTTKTEKT